MNNELNNLERRIDKLIAISRSLKEENLHLKLKNQELSKDHVMLNEKTRLAKSRLDNIIGRLKDVKMSEA